MLAGFLPSRLPGSWEPGCAERFSAVVMLVDVRRFTSLSEAAARDGPAGAERLSRAINAVFAPIVEAVRDCDGEVALYVGDCVVALFPTVQGAGAGAAAVHGLPGLDVSIGLAAGDLVRVVVGDTRREHVLIGGALARAAATMRAGPVRLPPATWRGGAWPAPLVAVDGARFLHPSVAARLAAGRERALAEHRRVTSLFLRFEALSEADPHAPDRLHEVAETALETLARFDGALLQIELVDKGSTLKATFGAPVAHADDERRATACARALLARRRLEGCSIGLATGTVYCGLIGSATRHEYTVLGDAVNVAARLMCAARPGQILASAATRERAEDRTWSTAGSLLVRGRAEPVEAFEPGEATSPPAARPVVRQVGREAELARVLERLARAAAGEGGVVTISGEAGIGKSRLLDAVISRVRGMTVLRGAGEPYGRDRPYGAWTAVFGAPVLTLFGGDPDLSPELRAVALRERVVERLKAQAPLLLAFEDCQWLDEPSRELLTRLAREIASAPILLVLTVRTGEPASGGALPNGERLALEPLSHEALTELAPGVTREIIERSGGNPLFATQLVKLVNERGDDLALPDSLRAAVVARLDTLAEDERAVLRVASVIGLRFASAWLCGSDEHLGGPAAVARALRTLAALGLVRPDGAEHAFEHAVTREVAYDTLAVAAREHLHGAVAQYLERTQDLDAAEVLELLAHHYTRAADADKQRVYLRLAGDAARDAFANDTALRHYRRLVELLDGEPALTATLDLGGVLELTGAWTEARALYGDALSRTGDPRALAALGGLLAFTGAYPAAVERLEQARAGLDGAARASVLAQLAHTYFQQGDDARAIERALEHLRLARRLGDRRGESTALNTLGLVSWHQGDLTGAQRHLREALALATVAGHRVGVVHLLNDLAGVLVALGHAGEAIARLREAYTHARAIGYRRFEGLVVGNAAELYQLAGQDAAALACAGRSLAIGIELGDVLPVVHNATVVAAVLVRQGSGDTAAALLERVVAVTRASDNRRYLAEALIHLARATGDRTHAARAVALAADVGQASLAAQAEAVLNGATVPEPVVVLGDDGSFIEDEAPDPTALAARALAALSTSNDVVAAGEPLRAAGAAGRRERDRPTGSAT